MTKEAQRFLDHLGVTAWHKAGYTGSRGLTGTAESVGDGATEHARMTAKVFHAIAPDRRLIHVPYSTSYIDGHYVSRFLEEGLPIIREQGVDTMFQSLGGNITGHVLDDALAGVADRFTYFVSAGNGGGESYNRTGESPYIIAVAAYQLMADGTMARPGYSSMSETVEFAAPTLMFGFAGTSCSCPALCGMAALVNDLFMDKTGRPLSCQAMQQFFRDCAVDLDAPGRDEKSGWGAPILPPPGSIDIQKYAGGNDMIYQDDSKISPYHRDDVYRALALELMAGDGVNFNPQEPVTREQLASVAVRLYDRLKGVAGQ